MEYNRLIKEIFMKKAIALACLGFSIVVSVPAFAGAQQDKMRGCNTEAKADALKGDERKAFMKKCLSKDYILKGDTATEKPQARTEGAPEATAPMKQQDKMKSCNADAKTKALKGDERKAFMKTCLKG
jgi:hypothetical protein